MTDAEATLNQETGQKKSALGAVVVPLAALLVGAAGGATGMYFMPGIAPGGGGATATRPAKPVQYYDINNSFTTNLKDSDRMVQLKVAVSTTHGTPVIDALEKHRLPMIAAVLAALSDCSEEDIESPAGRERLTFRIRSAINKVLQDNSGLSGVDEVFLTSLILQ